MKNPIKKLKDVFSLEAVEQEGLNYKSPPPMLSAKKKAELLEATSLETPRNLLRSVFGVLKPYWTKSSNKEKVIASALLATSLFMTWYAVQVTVDFGHWQSSAMNILGQIGQTILADRPEIATEFLNSYSSLQGVFENNPLLNELLIEKFPDVSSVMYDPAFRDLLSQNPELREVIGQNPKMVDVFMSFPGMKEQVAANPELLDQLTSLNEDLKSTLPKIPIIAEHMKNLWMLVGGDFINNWGGALKTTFNVAADTAKNGTEILNENVSDAFENAWNSKDFVNIALKFTGMAVVGYKASQFLGLRWRAWSSGYYASRFLENKAYLKLKNRFNNIDNPGQRIQEDPAKFTYGSISLMTGVMSSIMTFGSFSGMLVGMGDVAGVPYGIALASATYAAALTALTMGVGWKLPWIQRNQQSKEADFRDSLTSVYNNADMVAQNNCEEVEKRIIGGRLRPVIKNSDREIGTQVKLTLIDALPGNLSIPLPLVVGGWAMIEGTMSLGGVSTLNYAFNRVTSSMSFIVNRFEQLSQMKATGDRIYLMDQAIEYGHYLEEEKRQILAQKSAGNPKGPKSPSAGMSK